MYCMYEYQTTGSCVSKNWGSSFVLRVIFAWIVSAGMEFPFFFARNCRHLPDSALGLGWWFFPRGTDSEGRRCTRPDAVKGSTPLLPHWWPVLPEKENIFYELTTRQLNILLIESQFFIHFVKLFCCRLPGAGPSETLANASSGGRSGKGPTAR